MADGARAELLEAEAIGVALAMHARSVRRRADREGWPSESRTGIGGKAKVYPLDSLPEDVRASIARHRALEAASNAPKSAAETLGRQFARGINLTAAVDDVTSQRTRERGQAAAAALTGTAADRMNAKLELLARFDAFHRERGIGLCAARAEFCEAYNSGAMQEVHHIRKHTGSQLHPQTLSNWQAEVKKSGAAALGGRYGNRRGSGLIDRDNELLEFILGVLADRPSITAKLLHDAIDARMPSKGLKKRALERWLARWKVENADIFTMLKSPDAWKGRYMPAFGSYSKNVTRLNQVWMLDSTPADVMLIDGRHNLIGVIDVFPRRFKLYVTKTSTAEAVCQLTRRTIMTWGVPELVRIDNGRDYASERFAGLLRGVGIESHFSTPFAPWEKPHIERAFRTFSHNLLTLLDDYIGHNVAEQQAIRDRKSFADQLMKKGATIPVKLTADQLQAFCDRWCESYYYHEPHAGEGMDGMSPFQKVASVRDTVRMVQDERALDMLIGAGAMCTVQKKGIRFENLIYVAPELGGVVGQRVLVRRDEGDIGRLVVYHDDAFLCIAECPDVTGVSLPEIAAEAKQRRTKELQDIRRKMKQLGKKANTKELAEDILRAREERNASLVALPAPNVTHITPALEAASQAADALAAYDRGEPSATQVAEIHAGMVAVTRTEQEQDETGEQRFEAALRLLIKPEDTLNDIERARLKTYQSSAEFTSRWALFTEFGAEMFGLSAEFDALIPTDAPFHKQGAY